MRKRTTVTTSISIALRNRLAKEASRQGMSLSAFLEDQLSFYYYGRGRKAEHFLDKPKPAHIEAFENAIPSNLQ